MACELLWLASAFDVPVRSGLQSTALQAEGNLGHPSLDQAGLRQGGAKEPGSSKGLAFRMGADQLRSTQLASLEPSSSKVGLHQPGRR